MFFKAKIIIIIAGMIVFFSVTRSSSAEAQQIETIGSIGFTGIYEPIGTPDPIPPESIVRPPINEVAKPGGTLPQTNEVVNSWLIWLGVLLIYVVFLLWKRQKIKIQN